MSQEIHFRRLNALLWTYGYEVRDRYRNELARNKINATGKLSQTAEPVVKDEGNAYTLYLRLEDYWKYVEYGTRLAAGHAMGNRPPIAPFISWVRAKGIPVGSRGVIPTAYAIANKVWKTGTLPKRVLQTATYDIDHWNGKLERAASEDLQEWMENTDSVNLNGWIDTIFQITQ